MLSTADPDSQQGYDFNDDSKLVARLTQRAKRSKTANKVELNKNGRPVGWHDQSWMYYKKMVEIALEEKRMIAYANGDVKLAFGASDDKKKVFMEAQAKVKQIIMASLSMAFGQRLMVMKSGTKMWKYLGEMYEGKQNAATRTNQEEILLNKLQASKYKPNWDVAQHVDNMFMMRAQRTALSADMRDPIFINLLMKSLPPNSRFDRLRGKMETGASEVDTL
ncbi:hypothetical protein PHMEG_00029277 [Phytophthora megakarya]|uniref:Uncharacterized protein n=1 Tax=Phytophthora megakarya TaxID=4795 RepID=A0A225V1H2_9STRA|nr:hypothetical protein PHMEG_00029277 [Phytophthora megakarya]